MIETVDFCRSFITWRIDTKTKPPKTVSHQPPYSLNNARVPVECRCTIEEKIAGATNVFYLGANCKTERVGVERDIWTEPNADFVPIVSLEHFLAIKTFSYAGQRVELYPPSLGFQPERQTVRAEEAFDDLSTHIVLGKGEVVDDPTRIVKEILNFGILNAVTEISNNRYTVRIEYPLKTINANERDNIYQPDTGPVIFPNLDLEPEQLLNGLELAFVAFNTPDWAEFLVREITPVKAGPGAPRFNVYHYSKPVRLKTRNTTILLRG